MGDTQSCLRNTSSQSSLDTPKVEWPNNLQEVRPILQEDHVYDVHWEGSHERGGDLINLGENDDDDDFLNSEESPSVSEVLPKTPRDVKGKKPSVEHFDWSVPRRCPRGAADENFPKPKLLSHSARRERLEELKRLNQQLKGSSRIPPPPVKFKPARRTVSYSDASKPSEGSKGPSLLELEVQALASLGFVKLQPDVAVEPDQLQKQHADITVEPGPSQKQYADIAVEPGPSQQKVLSGVDQLDPKRAGPSVTKPSEPPKKEPAREDLLELEKVALRSMKAAEMPWESPQGGGAGSDILERQKVALSTTRAALHHKAITQVLPSRPQSQETAKRDLLVNELQMKALPPGKCQLHRDPTLPTPSPSQGMVKVKCLLHQTSTTSASKPPLPPPQDFSARSNVIDVQKPAQPYWKCKLHADGASPRPPVAPSSERMLRCLDQPPRKCFLHHSTADLQSEESPGKSVLTSASPAPHQPPLQAPSHGDLLELQKAALRNMREASTTSPGQSDVAQPVAPSATSQPVAAERGDLLELEKVALAKMKETLAFPPLQSVAAAVPPRNASPPESDLLELQNLALASMKSSAKSSQEVSVTAGSQAATKTSLESEKSDLLELQRKALANMLAASKQDGQGDLKVETSTIAKDEVQSSVASPTSSCSSFDLEPASGPLETMLVELTAKDKALQTANRKVAEKEQLLHEYEGELSKALRMLESMSARCTDAKEETARALSEAKHIYDELTRAWSAVEDLETRSKDGVAVSPENVDQECNKQVQNILREKEESLEDKERKKWIEDFLEELQRIESARSDVQRDFEQQIQRNEKIILELQHLRETPSTECRLRPHEGECQGMHGLTHEHRDQSNSGQRECDHVFLEQVPSNETEIVAHTQSLERTSKQLILELRNIELTGQENQKLIQEQMDRNEQVLAQLQELRSYCQGGKQEQALMASEQKKKWEAEEAQLNARISELNEALHYKTREANELHEGTLRLKRSVLEQEQRQIKNLQDQKTDSFRSANPATADFNGDTSELDADVFPSYSSTPQKTDFVGDTLDLELYLCPTCSLAEYICANCSTGPTGSDTTPATKFCPSVKADTADFECDTRDLESVVYTMDFEGDTRELEQESAVCTVDFEGDTIELEKFVRTEYTADQSVQVRRDDRERKRLAQERENWEVERNELIKRLDDFERNRLAQERENWEVERKELIKRLDDFEASLLAKEEKIGNLIQKLQKDESTWLDEKYQLVKRAEDCETRLLAKEEEVIDLSTQLEMAKSTLQGFTCTDSSTVVSTSSDISTVPAFNKKGSKPGSQGTQRLGKSDARELLDLRCEVLSLKECLVIKGEALKTMENELARSYTIINELRTKLARAQESERSLLTQQNSHRLILQDSQLTNGHSLGQKLKGKATKKPRLLRESDQATTRSNQSQGELLEKLRVQSEKLAAVEKERAIMSRKFEDLTAKCKYFEGIEKMYRDSQDPLKAEAIMELEKELERNVEIIKKIQLRCSEFESRAVEAENRLKQVQSDDNAMVPNGPKDKKAWQAEREGILAGLKYFQQQTEKKDEELYQLRYELRTQKQKQNRTSRTSPAPCKSSLIIECPETRNGSVVEMVVHDTNSTENSNLQLARVHAPTAAILEFERRDNNHKHHCDYSDHEDETTSPSQASQIRELTKHLRDQWEVQCIMEDRLDGMMAYVSDRVKEFEQQSRNIAQNTNFAQFHEEASLMKSQLEQQLHVLRGTLSTSFHKLDEAKRQLQMAVAVSAAGKEVQSFVAASDTTERSADDEDDDDAADKRKGKAFQLMSEKVALEDSAQTLQEKTSRLLHRLTSTRLQWNMSMLAASMAAG